jgi:hypothetical protein
MIDDNAGVLLTIQNKKEWRRRKKRRFLIELDFS